MPSGEYALQATDVARRVDLLSVIGQRSLAKAGEFFLPTVERPAKTSGRRKNNKPVSFVARNKNMPEQGTVKWFKKDKGFGFIVREPGADVFVHESSIIAEGFRTLNEGDRVSFDVAEGPKGLVPKNVVKIS
jgi:cold shock protein